MNPSELAAEKYRLEAQHGAWTAHNFELAPGLCTMAPTANGGTYRIRRFLQIAEDLAGRPLSELRVLDLACLEGLYAAEFARRGAAALGVEIREANLAKARLAQRAFGLTKLEFVRDDVRNLSAARYGQFDVTICSGILYHLEAADAVRLIHNLGAMTTRLLIVDLRFALAPEQSIVVDRVTYWGRPYREHQPGSTAAERAGNLWASIDNETSFWFTRESLVNLMRHSGFSSVFECHAPALMKQLDDRITLVGVRRSPAMPSLSPTKGLDDRDAVERNPIW